MKEMIHEVIKNMKEWNNNIDYNITTCVIPIIPSQSNHECLIKLDAKLVEHKFINCIEEMIFGGSIMNFFNNSVASSFCAKLFRDGDLVFRCLDCSMDDTCSFCLDCFKNSSHSTHNYRTYRSLGNGGYCDCGDNEAWTTEPTCSIHQNNTKTTTNMNEIQKEKLKIMMCYIFSYMIYTFYNMKQYIECSNTDLLDEDEYVIAVFNDESHTYNEVMDSLTNVVKCSTIIAESFAANIDKNGLGIVFKHADITNCRNIMNQLDEYYTQKCKKPPLKSCVMGYKFYLKLRLMKYLIKSIGKLCTFSDEIKRIVGNITVQPFDRTHFDSTNQLEWFSDISFEYYCDTLVPTIAEFFLLQNIHIWKELRLAIRMHLILKIIPLEDIKLKYAIIYAKKCKTMYIQEFSDDHSYEYSILNIFVQIFTSKSIAWYILQNTNMLQSLMFILGELTARIGYSWTNLNNCIHVCMSQIGELLLHCPSSDNWNDNFHKTIHHSLVILIDNLLEETNMISHSIHPDVIRRQHMYETGFGYVILVEDILYTMYYWITSNKKLYMDCIRSCIVKFYKIQSPRHISMQDYLNDHINDIVVDDTAIKLMNTLFLNVPYFHYMKLLLRFITLLHTRWHKFNIDPDEFILSLNNEDNLNTISFFKQSFDTIGIYAQDYCHLLNSSKDTLHTVLSGFYVMPSNCYLRSIMDKMTLQISLELTDPVSVFEYFRDCFFANYNIFYSNVERLLNASRVKAVERFNTLTQLFYITIFQVASFRNNQFVLENDTNSDTRNYDNIIDDIFIHHAILYRSTYDQYEKLYSKFCKQVGIEEKSSSLETIMIRLFDVRTSTLENIQRYVLKPIFYTHINKYCIYCNNSEIVDLENVLEYHIKANHLENYKGGIDYLPLITGQLGEKFFTFIANSTLRDMIIRSLQINLQIPLDPMCIDVIIHICYLVVYDAHYNLKNCDIGIPHIVKSFFTGTNMCRDDNDCILTLIKQLNISESKLTTKLLYNNLIKLMETEYYHFGDYSGTLTHSSSTYFSNPIKIDHKKLALERMKKMQKNFLEKNVEAQQFLDIIESDKDDDIIATRDFKIPLIGPKKALYFQRYPPNAVLAATCIFCQEENHLSMDENPYEQLFNLSGYTAFCYMTDSNILSSFNDLSQSLFDLENNPSELLSPYRHIEDIFCTQSYGFNRTNIPPMFRTSGLHLGGCGHIAHHSCWDQHVNSLFPRHEFGSNNDTEYECTLCYSLLNATIPCVIPNKIDYHNYNDFEFHWQPQLHQFHEYIDFIDRQSKNLDHEILNNDMCDVTFSEIYQQEPLANFLNRLGWFTKLGLSDNNHFHFILTSLIYTIQCCEINATTDKLSILGSQFFDNYRINTLRYTTKYVVFLAQLYGYNFSKYTQYTTTFMNLILQLYRIITNQRSNLLYYMDYFKTMTIIYVAMCSMIRICKLEDQHTKTPLMCRPFYIEKFCLTLFYTLHGMQSLKTLDHDSNFLNISIDDTRIEKLRNKVQDSTINNFLNLYNHINRTNIQTTYQYQLYYRWICSMLPFLRSSGILFRILNDYIVININNEYSNSLDNVDEFYNLIDCFDLPLDYTVLVEGFMKHSNDFEPLIVIWKNQSNHLLDQSRLYMPSIYTTKKFTVELFPLMQLPNNHLDLILLANSKKSTICTNKYRKKDDTGLCLVCNEFICLCVECNRNFSAMETHSNNCPGICSIILIVIDCTVKFCYKNKISKNFSFPYVNSKGQSGSHLQHCSNLTYNRDFHQNLIKLWRNHAIQHTIYSSF